MSEHTLICPLSVPVTKRKRWTLNLNNYRNTYYQTLNKAKINFFNEMREQIAKLPRMNKVEVTFTLWRKDHRRVDTRNICIIVDKFLMDAIVKMKKLPDDDYAHDVRATYEFGGVDPKRPRVTVTIKEIK
jgi:hypothetical protein